MLLLLLSIIINATFFLLYKHLYEGTSPIMAEGIIDRGGIQARVADIADSNRRDAAINHGQKEKEAEENRYQEKCFWPPNSAVLFVTMMIRLSAKCK